MTFSPRRGPGGMYSSAVSLRVCTSFDINSSKRGESSFALGLASLRVRTHPLEFRFDRALAGLFLARFRAEAFVFCVEPAAVVAFERDAAAAVEFEDPACDVVEKIAIVRDGDDGARIFAEEALEPRNAFGIQMVRRFVEQQHVGTRQQQRAQRDAAFFAAGQIFDVGVPRRAGAAHRPRCRASGPGPSRSPRRSSPADRPGVRAACSFRRPTSARRICWRFRRTRSAAPSARRHPVRRCRGRLWSDPAAAPAAGNRRGCLFADALRRRSPCRGRP